MVSWKIDYWCVYKTDESPLEAILDSLTYEQFKSIAKEIKLLEICGNTLRLPHSKPLGNGLFELRERRYGYRVYYAFFKDKVIIILHFGCKSNQDSDIKIARVRLAELLRGQEHEN
jgi:putative addiction module killer protein